MKKSLPNDLLIPEVAELIRQGHTVTLTARVATWCRGTGPDG